MCLQELLKKGAVAMGLVYADTQDQRVTLVMCLLK